MLLVFVFEAEMRSAQKALDDAMLGEKLLKAVVCPQVLKVLVLL